MVLKTLVGQIAFKRLLIALGIISLLIPWLFLVQYGLRQRCNNELLRQQSTKHYKTKRLTRRDWLDQLDLDYDNDTLIVFRSPKITVNESILCKRVRGRRVIATYASHGGHIDLAIKACKIAIGFPGIDVCLLFKPNYLDVKFKRQHETILSKATGAGYWLWKPYIVLRLLLMIDKSDVLLYMDADKILIDNIEEYICVQAHYQQDVCVFPCERLAIAEYTHTKADIFLFLNVENLLHANDTSMMYAAYIMFRKSLTSIQFVGEWLTYCQDDRVNTDEPNKFRKNPKTFEHTLHDQSVLSLLSKKWNFSSWPSPELEWNHTQYHENKFGFAFHPYNMLPLVGDYKQPSRPIIVRQYLPGRRCK